LGWVDRISGALFSTFVGFLIVIFGVNISNKFLPDNNITGQTSQEESLLYKKVAEITYTIIKEVKDEVNDEIEID
jgi:uncharacterized membrane protein required for colicin V production